MSKLSQAIDDVTSAAADLRATAAALKGITAQLDTRLLPEMETVGDKAGDLIAQSSGSVAVVEGKAVALIGHLGELVEKITAIAAAIRDGAWVELEGVSFGGELKMAGRVRLAAK